MLPNKACYSLSSNKRANDISRRLILTSRVSRLFVLDPQIKDSLLIGISTRIWMKSLWTTKVEYLFAGCTSFSFIKSLFFLCCPFILLRNSKGNNDRLSNRDNNWAFGYIIHELHKIRRHIRSWVCLFWLFFFFSLNR